MRPCSPLAPAGKLGIASLLEDRPLSRRYQQPATRPGPGGQEGTRLCPATCAWSSAAAPCGRARASPTQPQPSGLAAVTEGCSAMASSCRERLLVPQRIVSLRW